MIRTVADRIASSTRPAYRGRHRRARSGRLASVFRAPPAEPHAREAAERLPEEELAVGVGGPAAPPA